jgi:hypothetical protein
MGVSLARRRAYFDCRLNALWPRRLFLGDSLALGRAAVDRYKRRISRRVDVRGFEQVYQQSTKPKCSDEVAIFDQGGSEVEQPSGRDFGEERERGFGFPKCQWKKRDGASKLQLKWLEPKEACRLPHGDQSPLCD